MMKKLPALNKFNQSVDVLEFDLIISASHSLEMIGGTGPPSSGLPPLKASFVKEVIVSLVLKIDTALIAKLTAPVPVVET